MEECENIEYHQVGEKSYEKFEKGHFKNLPKYKNKIVYKIEFDNEENIEENMEEVELSDILLK